MSACYSLCPFDCTCSIRRKTLWADFLPRPSSVTRIMICTFRFLFSMSSLPFADKTFASGISARFVIFFSFTAYNAAHSGFAGDFVKIQEKSFLISYYGGHAGNSKFSIIKFLISQKQSIYTWPEIRLNINALFTCFFNMRF